MFQFTQLYNQCLHTGTGKLTCLTIMQYTDDFRSNLSDTGTELSQSLMPHRLAQQACPVVHMDQNFPLF